MNEKHKGVHQQLSAERNLHSTLASYRVEAIETENPLMFGHAAIAQEKVKRKIENLEAAQYSLDSAYEQYANTGELEQPIGATTLAALIAREELRLN